MRSRRCRCPSQSPPLPLHHAHAATLHVVIPSSPPTTRSWLCYGFLNISSPPGDDPSGQKVKGHFIGGITLRNKHLQTNLDWPEVQPLGQWEEEVEAEENQHTQTRKLGRQKPQDLHSSLPSSSRWRKWQQHVFHCCTFKGTSMFGVARAHLFIVCLCAFEYVCVALQCAPYPVGGSEWPGCPCCLESDSTCPAGPDLWAG